MAGMAVRDSRQESVKPTTAKPTSTVALVADETTFRRTDASHNSGARIATEVPAARPIGKVALRGNRAATNSQTTA